MDESWRMTMGMPTTQPAKANLPASRQRRTISGESSDPPLEPEDFSDVFGGPPRTILTRQFSDSAGFLGSSSTSSFYEEILHQPENVEFGFGMSGRSLPEFRIPARQQRNDHNQSHHHAFYSDIFRREEENGVKSRSRSRSKSKTSSSSVLSSDELSPLRGENPLDGMDDISSFSSKLRPINVGCRWTSKRMQHKDYQRQQNPPPFSDNGPSYKTQNDYVESIGNYPFGFSRKNSSPETISLEPIWDGSVKLSVDDLDLKSPSSVVSSVCQEDLQNNAYEIEEETLQETGTEQDDDEIMSSYVIEINTHNRDSKCEAVGVDEAIAWAKEKFQTHCSENSHEQEKEKPNKGQKEGCGSTGLEDNLHEQDFCEQHDKRPAVETEPLESQSYDVKRELQILDEKVRLWTTGKENDIRLLLSTLHHILWPKSSWFAIPIANLTESSQVKKAYQKAQLCLHPDKLQQRGASFSHKYVAEKAFSVLQDAWAAFTSQNLSTSLKNY